MFDFSVFATPEGWFALLTLTLMEVVLGIDNIVFISIITDELPEEQQPVARTIGLSLAMFTRLALLFTITWIMKLQSTLFELFDHEFSGRDLILGGGGLFLLAKAVSEIFETMEVSEEGEHKRRAPSFAWAIVQIVIFDIIFSLDSVITAVGMSDHLIVMSLAVIIAIMVMLFFAGAISDFINDHPSMKILALSFLLLIGVMLVAESVGQHINKGYIYFAMTFALGVELVNMRMRKRSRTASVPEQ